MYSKRCVCEYHITDREGLVHAILTDEHSRVYHIVTRKSILNGSEYNLCYSYKYKKYFIERNK